MRTLLLMRHAKSSWGHPGVPDLERPLAPRGQAAAPLVARYLADHHLIPDLVLCSPARRVRETWQLMVAALGDGVACETRPGLYDAPPGRLLETLRGVDDEVRTLMLIGHNPGLGGLAASLAGAGDEGARQRLRAKFPTAGLAVLGVEGERWADLAAGSARLEDFVRPKDIS